MIPSGHPGVFKVPEIDSRTDHKDNEDRDIQLDKKNHWIGHARKPPRASFIASFKGSFFSGIGSAGHSSITGRACVGLIDSLPSPHIRLAP
jgi:hypothetical protein